MVVELVKSDSEIPQQGSANYGPWENLDTNWNKHFVDNFQENQEI